MNKFTILKEKKRVAAFWNFLLSYSIMIIILIFVSSACTVEGRGECLLCKLIQIIC